MGVLVVLLVVGLAFGGLGYYVSVQKGRPEAEGLILGFLFGPLGCLIAAILPSKARPSSRPRFARDRSAWVPDYDDAWDKPKGSNPEAEALDDLAVGWLNAAGGKPKGSLDMGAIGRAAKADAEAAIETYRGDPELDLGIQVEPKRRKK